MTLLFLLSSKPVTERSVWTKTRTSDVFIDAMNVWTDQDWKHHTRLSRQTFRFIDNKISQYIEKQDTAMRNAIPPSKRLLMTLWYLGTQLDFRSLGMLFGIAKSTACSVVHDVCSTMKRVLTPTFLKFPNENSAAEIISGFENMGFPQTIGAIDGTHIPILSPGPNSNDYYNRKGFYSVIMQAVVDCHYKFIDINIGWPGKAHDARVFRNSPIFAFGEQNRLPGEIKEINGINIPVHLIGDAAYPLLNWLMTPFKGRLNAIQNTYNYKLSSARMVVENSFGRLKARWRRLLKRFDGSIPFLLDVIVDCVVLHNICEINKETCIDEWFNQGIDRDLEIVACNQENEIDSARNIRTAIANFVQ